MKQGLSTSLGLLLKILIILLLPLLLFRYVDSQLSVVVDDKEDEGTREVAIVNEDIGYESETEEIILGQDITALLNNRDDYAWTVVNRSAAEQGFSNQKYDAILYVPSNFSENIMTFKDESPMKASINYVIQPNLEAKERQRIHREMANAKNEINNEMSTIYWSYVSQEVDNIREQFDNILEKEIAFQDAIYSFYAPSSETLANEIERHKNRLEGIMNQTDRVNEISADSAGNAVDAEEKIAEFTEALDMYKESQTQKELLFTEAQLENQTAIQLGVDSYKEALENYSTLVNEQVNEYESPVFRQQDNFELLDKRFTRINDSLTDGKEAFDKWDKEEIRNLKKQIYALNEVVLEEYNRQLSIEAKDNVLATINNLEDNNNDEEDDLDKPEIPEIDDDDINFDELKNNIEGVRSAVKELENKVGDSITINEAENEPTGDEEESENESKENEVKNDSSSTIAIDWNSVYQKLQNIDGEDGIITSLETEMNQKDVPIEKQIAGWEDAYEELNNVANNLN